ncbi:SGNH/GDSL hydrolase family protein [Bacillus sp. FJAT-27251]|uniref:SGNH/GDSL hydrolase family protein n=1 Tax=Bacillus sp. FJAT-27251 TaxID=1684142 RepID=UPI0006A77D25|nr:SGNH/GDSL hydrolase family protein [Bacillus sp. FJAT-27251]
MKNVIVGLLALGCAALLIAGNQHWKEKTAVSADPPGVRAASDPVPAEEPKVNTSDLLSLTANWPEEAQQQFEKSLADGSPFTILIAGSPALGTEEAGWSSKLKAELESAFGEHLDVIVKSYDTTSAQFIENGHLDELVETRPDLTLLEPFTLMDNGNVMISHSHEHLDTIASGLQEANPEHVLIVQPPHPLYNASYYPIQVDALKKHAEKRGLPYLDHWGEWPEQDSKDLNDYLVTKDKTTLPNEQGHLLWAEYLADYFIAH